MHTILSLLVRRLGSGSANARAYCLILQFLSLLWVRTIDAIPIGTIHGKHALLDPLVDVRYISHRMLAGKASLRLNEFLIKEIRKVVACLHSANFGTVFLD